VIVVDTNVVSELMRPSPSPGVRDWVNVQAPGELCTTAVTVAEIRYGLERLPDGRRKDILLATATEVFTAFSEFIQPFDADAAVWYATIVARRDRLGLPIDGFDAQTAGFPAGESVRQQRGPGIIGYRGSRTSTTTAALCQGKPGVVA
jgi:toxin FitB